MLKAYREFLPDAPRQLNGFFAYAQVPPAPPFPEELLPAPGLRGGLGLRRRRGRGPAGHGAAAGQRAGAVAARRRADAARRIAGRVRCALPQRRSVVLAGRLRQRPSPTPPSTSINASDRRFPTFKSTMHLYPIDGAAHDVGSGDTAWAYRDATWGSVFAGVGAEPSDADAIRRWSIDYFEALHPYSAGGRLREHDDGRRRRPSPRQLPRQLSAAGPDQGHLRPRKPVQGQPEHPASGIEPIFSRVRLPPIVNIEDCASTLVIDGAQILSFGKTCDFFPSASLRRLTVPLVPPRDR